MFRQNFQIASFITEKFYSQSIHHTEIKKIENARKSILKNNTLTELDRFKQLITNDHERLKQQLQLEAEIFRGRCKNRSKTQQETDKLDGLIFLLTQTPIDYRWCLNYSLELIANQDLQGKMTENLEQALNYFPYNNLPLDAIKNFLTILNTKLSDEEKSQPAITFFNCKNPSFDIKLLRKQVPTSDIILNNLTPQDIYKRFHNIEESLKIKTTQRKEFYNSITELINQIKTPATQVVRFNRSMDPE